VAVPNSGGGGRGGDRSPPGTRWRTPAELLHLRPPGRPDPGTDRHATWLELFFDLVFVLALTDVTRRLNQPALGVREIAAALGIFILVQWAWLGLSFYDTRFDPDDVPHRLLVFGAVAGAGAITLGARQVPAGVLLPVGYLIARGCLLAMYLRVFGASDTSRQLVTVYLTGFGTSWLLWLGSLTLPAPNRPVVWVTGLSIELLTPWLGRRWLARHPVDATHLPERIGQFTIILLGSTLTNLRDAVPTPHPPARAVAAAATASLVPVCIWWVYTAFVSSRMAVPRLGAGQAYSYLHGPAGAAVLFLGWALGQVVHEVTAGSARLPAVPRVVLSTSIVVWMLCGLGFRWFAVGSVSRQRVVVAVLTALPIVLVGAVATRPALTLAVVAAVMVGYAIVINRQIAAYRAGLAPDGG
jgi:low temperature requirement protein LtrA